MEKDDRYTRITLRIPKDLHERLSNAADDTSKSMNAEIIARLEESFESRPVGPMTIGYMLERIAEIGEASGRTITVTLGEVHRTESKD